MIVKPTIPFNSPLKYRLIRQLYFSGVASCNDLSEALGKSLPHIAKSLYELIDEGFVVEKGYAPSNGGRPPLIYALQPDRLYILSVAIDQLYTRIGVLDLSGQFLFPHSRKLKKRRAGSLALGSGPPFSAASLSQKLNLVPSSRHTRRCDRMYEQDLVRTKYETPDRW